jgi:hypothetical protein
MSLSPLVRDLLEQIYSHEHINDVDEEHLERLRRDPEVQLVALLREMLKGIPDRALLRETIENSTYDVDVEAASKLVHGMQEQAA